MTGHCGDLSRLGQLIKETVYSRTGLPVGVGISTTKTLAKLASYAGKKYRGTRGVVDLTSVERQRKLMAITPVEEVWGVGSRYAERLKALGIETAAALAESDTRFIREQFNIVLEKTVRELRGESVMPLELVPPTQKQIVHSRSFGRPIQTVDEMEKAIHNYAAKAMEKLRKKNLRVKTLSVFIQTSPFRDADYYYNSATTQFPISTTDTRIVLAATTRLLTSIWKGGRAYIRAGVMFLELESANVDQRSLFQERDERAERLMQLIDKCNSEGKVKLFFASQGIGNSAWEVKRNFLSKSYLTKWSDIPWVS